MSLSGSLSEFSVLETLQMIGNQKKTGTLELECGRERRALHFHDGALIGCQPTRPHDPDSYFTALVGLGQLSVDEERRLRAAAAESGADAWQLVDESSPLDRDTLAESRRLAIQGTLDRVLLWNRGHFQFGGGASSASAADGWNIEQALLESMRRLDEATDLRGGEYPLASVPTRTGSSEARSVELEDPASPALERAFLAKIDGKLHLHDLIRSLGVAEYDVLSTARSLRQRHAIRIDTKARADGTQILLEQPSRLRQPGLLVCGLALAAVLLGAGWTAHRTSDRAARSLDQLILEPHARYERERAVRLALEVYCRRFGTYPERLSALVDESLWPEAERDRLEEAPYRVSKGGGDYGWSSATTPEANSNKSSNTRTPREPVSVSRP